MKNKTKTIMLGLVLAAMVVISGCAGPVSPGETVYTQEGLLGNNDVKESNFQTVEEYQNFVRDNVQDGRGGIFYGVGAMVKSAGTAMESASVNMDMVTSSGDGSAPSDFSGTNNQVAGVDEADMLKTDGSYIYTITDKVVFIIKAYPGEESEVVSKIVLEDYPTSLFVNGDKLAVIGTVNDFDFLKEQGFSRNQGFSYVKIYDISDRAKPELVNEIKVEGQYNNARMQGNEIYLVSTFYPEYRKDYPVPVLFNGDVLKEMAVQDIHYFNIPYSNPSMVIVNSIDIESAQPLSSEAITIEGYPTIYMSEDNMYVVYTEYINEWEFQQQVMIELIVPKLSEEDRNFIERIKTTDADILSKYEKQMKILQVTERYLASLPEDEMDDLQEKIDLEVKERLEEFKYMEYTIINKLSVSDGEIELQANGKVPGHISNQFSMDEYKGNFRIATTISQRWSRFIDEPMPVDIGGGIGDSDVASDEIAVSSKMAEPSIMPPKESFSESMNNLYVLNSDLKVIGSVEGLAEGEQIFSVRFIEDRAYLVTFRQVDPFFVVDLKNPSSPDVLGQLKVPGFSRYLHPYDDNVIIGIGRDATESGRQEGLKISLFDVTDVENPKEIAKYVSDEKYSSSTAEWEHKAFLFSKDKNLLVIPMYSYDYRGGDNMNGALVFSITEKSIVLRGLIDHSGNNMYGPSVERSLYIENMLYTKSPYLLRVNDLEDLSSVKNVTLSTKDSASIKTY